MRTRLLTAALVLGTAGFAFVPIASAAPASQDAPPSTQAWYQVNATCSTPAGCQSTDAVPVVPPALPVPAPVPVPGLPVYNGTLRIGVAGGTETARAVLGLPPAMTSGGLTSAALTIPLDVDQSDASVTPEVAKVLACVTRAPVVDGEARTDAPPATNCSSVVPLAYVPAPKPHLQADLAPVLPALQGATGLVLLPDRARLAPTEAWQVVFSTTTRGGSAPTGPASFRFAVADAPLLAPAPAEAQVPSMTVAAPRAEALVPEAPAGAAAVEPELGTPAVVAAAEAPSLAEQPAAVLAPAENQVALPRTIRVGYAYPVVWLVPLALLVLVPLVGRALTADLTRRELPSGS